MQYTNLGKTGMKVSRLCLGMMSYGAKSWREWVLDEEQAKPFVRRALDAGINFFDTADVYSLGESEKITGNLLKYFGVRRENVKRRALEAILLDPLGGSRKHVLPVMIESQDERAIHLNAIVVQHADAPRIVARLRCLLPCIGEILIRERLEPHEHARTSGEGHRTDQSRVIGDIDRNCGAPNLIQRS